MQIKLKIKNRRSGGGDESYRETSFLDFELTVPLEEGEEDFRLRKAKEAVINLTVTVLREGGGADGGCREEREVSRRGCEKAFNFPVLAGGGAATHPSVRSCHSGRVMVAE